MKQLKNQPKVKKKSKKDSKNWIVNKIIKVHLKVRKEMEGKLNKSIVKLCYRKRTRITRKEVWLKKKWIKLKRGRKRNKLMKVN